MKRIALDIALGVILLMIFVPVIVVSLSRATLYYLKEWWSLSLDTVPDPVLYYVLLIGLGILGGCLYVKYVV